MTSRPEIFDSILDTTGHTAQRTAVSDTGTIASSAYLGRAVGLATLILGVYAVLRFGILAPPRSRLDRIAVGLLLFPMLAAGGALVAWFVGPLVLQALFSVHYSLLEPLVRGHSTRPTRVISSP